MADALNLDPGGYTGTYKLIGGTPVLDFANLVSYRGTGRAHDWLDPVTNVYRWADAVGLPADSEAGIDDLRALRELLARVFLATADHKTPDAADIDRLGALATDAAARRRLHFPEGADAATWTHGRPSLVDQLALPAAEILTSVDVLRRVSACDECRWLYLDTTRNHTRRWCDPADCGNRARQRRHYHRHRPARYNPSQAVEGGDR
ncbi:MAG TPA: ABATE domain-containing protein [Jiangellaceae bacterium]|nr:ABATE domain-containing protein [Jiangellaceae bacterium]